MERYVIEVAQHYPNGIYYHPSHCDQNKCKNKNGCYYKNIDILGCINKIFDTKEEASEYYIKYYETII